MRKVKPLSKITKPERLAAYKYALKSLNTKKRPFICSSLDAWLMKNKYPVPTNTPTYFPELMKHKPKNSEPLDPWFTTRSGGMEKRKEILRTIIKEMTPIHA